MTLLFTVLMIVVFGKLLGFAVRAAWSISKIICSVLLLPLTILGFFLCGFIHIAFVLVIAVGIITLFGGLIRAI